MRIAVLGATGFIGTHLIASLAARQFNAVAIVRRPADRCPLPCRVVPDFRDSEALRPALVDVDVIVHLADEAGRFDTAGAAPPIARALADAITHGGSIPPRRPRRLIFASSIYARLDEQGDANPYGARKRQQEDILLAATPAIGLRLPPVYGAGCGGSFAMLDRAAQRGLPLPFGKAVAPRSYLAIENLCDLVIALVTADERAWAEGASALYEPEDALRISTRDLAVALARRHGRRPRLLSVPHWLMAAAAAAVGRRELVRGAFDPLAATGNAELARIFGWRPRTGLPASMSPA